MRFLSSPVFFFSASFVTAKIVTPEVDSFINNLLSEWHTPSGISLAVVSKAQDGSWEIETKGYGASDLKGTPVDESTLFYIGSNSKLFNTIATGLVISNESLNPRIGWDSRMKDVFPDWKLLDSEATEKATIEDVMSHQTGLPRHDNALSTNTTQQSAFQDILPNLKSSAPFKAVFQYNNFAYGMLGFIPLQLTGTTVARYIQANIFDKLKMTSSTFNVQKADQTGKLAKGIGKDGLTPNDPFGVNATSREIPNFNPDSGDDGNVVSGAGGIISNAKDMAIWVQTLLLSGASPETNETVIPADVINKVSSSIVLIPSNLPPFPEQTDSFYGGGQESFKYRGEDVHEHGGEVIGFLSAVGRFPGRQAGVFVISNSHEYGFFLSSIIKYRLYDALLGLDTVDWNSRYKQIMLASLGGAAGGTPPPAAPKPPSAGFDVLQGMYDEKAYGAVELCYVPPNSAVSTTSTDSCKQALTNTPPSHISSASHKYVVQRHNSPFSTHWLISHHDGNVFNISAPLFEPVLSNGSSGAQEYWSLLNLGGGTLTFAEDGSGFGLAGGFWGAGSSVKSEPNGTTLQETSEAWFPSRKTGEQLKGTSVNSAVGSMTLLGPLALGSLVFILAVSV